MRLYKMDGLVTGCGILCYFIVIEGTDGSGKGIGKVFLKEFLEDKLNCKIIMTHEPTKHHIGKFIRSNIKDRTFDSISEALLFAADRIDHCEKLISPELEKGNIVISERYLYSSLAYQSIQEFNDLDWLLEINSHAIVPDLVIFVHSNIDKTMSRIRSSLREDEGISEYFEDDHLQKKVLKAYESIFGNFKKKGGRNKFFTPQLIQVSNEGSILKYQKKLKRRIIKYLNQQKVGTSLLKKNTTRSKKFQALSIDVDFNDREVLADFLRKTLEYSLRWKVHPENLPKTFVTRNMVNVLKCLTRYDKVVHKTIKKVHSENEIQIGYSLSSFRRIARALKDIRMIKTSGARSRMKYYFPDRDISNPEHAEKAEERYEAILKRYKKRRSKARRMVLGDYLYQLGAFLREYRSPILYAFVINYIDNPSDIDMEEYIRTIIEEHFNGKRNNGGVRAKNRKTE